MEPIPLFQFWNTPEAPGEVRELMRTWETEPGFSYRRHDSESAEALIAEHFDRDALDAFRQCAVPAMQADFFRYAALFVFGGAYLDADTSSPGGLASLLAGEGRGLLMIRQGRVANDVMFVRNPRDPLVQYAIETAVSNIRDRISNNVWLVTGPGILTKLHREESESTRRIFEGFGLEQIGVVRRHVTFHWDLDYKTGEDDWRAAIGSETVSIFKQPGA